MIERILLFGAGAELTGILTKPEESVEKIIKPAVLLLNAGFLHRVGFNRFNTDMARLLSRSGYSSLRFDLHGLGDSANYDGKLPYDEQIFIDIKDAIGVLLEKTGASHCILIGLCSGADYSHTVAVNDPRVCGVVLLDGYAYPTLGFYLRDYVPGVLNPLKIIKLIRKKIFYSRKTKLSNSDLSNDENEIYVRSFPPKKKIISEIQQLIDRDVYLYYIYSSGVPIYYNYAHQFWDMFRSLKFKDKVSHSYIAGSDHTYTLISLRMKLLSSIISWIESKFDR